MVGRIDNVEKAISSEWKNINDQIWLIGSHKSETTIAASSYLEYFHGEITGRPPKLDLYDEKICQSFLRNAILNSLVVSSPSLCQTTLKSSCSKQIVAFQLDNNKYHLEGLLVSFFAPKSLSHNSNDWSECWLIGVLGEFTKLSYQ